MASGILLITTAPWSATERLAGAMAGAGVTVDAVHPPGHALSYSRYVRRHFFYNGMAPLFFIRRAIAQRLQRFDAHRRILITTRRQNQCVPHLFVSRRGFQRFQAIQPHARVKAFSIHNDIGQHAPHIAVLHVSRKHQRLFRTHLQLHIR